MSFVWGERYREWDCYHDRPGDMLQISYGLEMRGVFIGVIRHYQETYTGENY